MPYRVLDAIERAAIRDKLLPIEVFEAVRPQFPQYETQQIGTWVERFFRLWCRNQWKRERYAPSFHLDDENLDPKPGAASRFSTAASIKNWPSCGNTCAKQS